MTSERRDFLARFRAFQSCCVIRASRSRKLAIGAKRNGSDPTGQLDGNLFYRVCIWLRTHKEENQSSVQKSGSLHRSVFGNGIRWPHPSKCGSLGNGVAALRNPPMINMPT